MYLILKDKPIRVLSTDHRLKRPMVLLSLDKFILENHFTNLNKPSHRQFDTIFEFG